MSSRLFDVVGRPAGKSGSEPVAKELREQPTRTRSSWRRRPRVVALAVVACLAMGGGVIAFFVAGATAGSAGGAQAGTLDTGNTPTTSVASRDVTVSWAQISPSFLDGVLGAEANGGYLVKRYAESGGGSITPGASCAGLQQGAADPLTCTEADLPTGRWQYSVTPKYYNWLGNESGLSASAIIAPTAPTAVTLVNGGGVGGVWVNQANESSISVDVALPATSLATDTVYLTISDGSNPDVTANLPATGGAETLHFAGLDVSGLDEGSLTFDAKSQSSYGDNSALGTSNYGKDATNPTVVVSASRAPDSNGWYNDSVTFSTSPGSSDAGSGLQSCQADVVYSGPDGTGFSVTRTCTDFAGNTDSGTSATFDYDDTNPIVTSVTPDRSPDHNGWYNHSVTWSASGTDATSGIASCESIAYSAPDGAGLTVSRSCTDAAGNSGSGSTPTFKYDGTAPEVTVSPARAPDHAGWYNAPVAFMASGTDTTSGIDTCEAPVNYISPDGTGLTVSRDCTDNAGNTGTGTSASFQFDDTNPSVSVSPDRGPDQAGWYNAPVTFTPSGSDSTSGIDSCQAPLVYSAPDGTGLTASRTCTDNAGNSGSGTSTTFMFDDTNPSVTVTPARSPDSNGWYNAPVTFTPSGSDATSGIASCQAAVNYTAPDGTGLTVSRTCTDAAGNTGSGTSTIFKYDNTNPALNLSLIAPASGAHAHAAGLVGTTIFFNSCAGDTPSTPGGFRLVSTVVDATAGGGSANYPALSATRWTTHNNETVVAPSGGPYTSTDFRWDAQNCGGQAAATPGNYTITAADAAGNTVATTLTFDPDQGGVSATVTHPASGTTAFSAAAWNAACSSAICGTATDTQGAGLQRVEMSIRQGSGNYWNGSSFSSATPVFNIASGTTTWTYAFPASNFPADGSYTVAVRAVDNAQNLSSTTSWTFTIDNVAPTGSITAPANGALVRATITVSSNSADTGGSGVLNAQFQRSPVGAGTWTNIGSADTSSPYSASFNTTGVTNGQYDLRVITTDTAGHTFTSPLVTVTVDNTAPTVAAGGVVMANGGVASRADANDTLTVTYSEVLDASTFCSGWTNSGNQTATGTATVSTGDSLGNISVTAGATCSGGFQFGTVALNADYISSSPRTYTISLTWNPTARTLTIQLTNNGSGGTVNTVAANSTPSYTADTDLDDLAGNPISAGPHTGTSSRF